jgi:hypothetical protein
MSYRLRKPRKRQVPRLFICFRYKTGNKCIFYLHYILFLLLKQTINKIKRDGLKGLQEEEIQGGLYSKKARRDKKMNKKEISHKKERR